MIEEEVSVEPKDCNPESTTRTLNTDNCDTPVVVMETKTYHFNTLTAASILPLKEALKWTVNEDPSVTDHAPSRPGNVESPSVTTKSTEDKTNVLDDMVSAGA